MISYYFIKCSMNKTQNRKIANRCAVKVNYTKSFIFISVILFKFLHLKSKTFLIEVKALVN